jgi:hypothetical protein
MPISKSEADTASERNRWELEERPFTSTVPIFGGLIVAIRNVWNSVAAKWYVRPLIEQQNQYNRLFAELIDHFNRQLVDDARENSEISHDIAELTTLLTSINENLASLEERLSKLENTAGDDSE